MTTPPLSSDRPAISMPTEMKERILYALTAFARIVANETDATLMVEVAKDCRTFTVVVGPSPAEERDCGDVVVDAEDELADVEEVTELLAPSPSPAPVKTPHAYPPAFASRLHLPGRQDN